MRDIMRMIDGDTICTIMTVIMMLGFIRGMIDDRVFDQRSDD